MTQPLFTPEQVAEYLGVSTDTVRRLVDRKMMGCHFILRARRFTQAHLDEYLKNGASRPPRKRAPAPPIPTLESAWGHVLNTAQEQEPLLRVALEESQLTEIDIKRRVATVAQRNQTWSAVLNTDKARRFLQRTLREKLGRTLKIEVTEGTR
jgi:excisionase family DNA binding protein